MEAGKGRSCYDQDRPREEDCSSRRPAPDQQEDAQEANRQTTQDHAGWKAARIQDPRPSRGEQRPDHWGKHLQKPSNPCVEKTPRDSESESGREGVAKAQSTQERSGAGSARGRSIEGWEPSDESRHRALSPQEEVQEEPYSPVRLSQPTGARGKAGSVRTEPQGTGPSLTQWGSIHGGPSMEPIQISIQEPTL